MKSIQTNGLTAPRFAASASVAPTGLAAAPCELAAFGHAQETDVSIVARVDRIPGGRTGVSVTANASSFARPRTSVCRRLDL